MEENMTQKKKLTRSQTGAMGRKVSPWRLSPACWTPKTKEMKWYLPEKWEAEQNG
jgi:hypothetical protein